MKKRRVPSGLSKILVEVRLLPDEPVDEREESVGQIGIELGPATAPDLRPARFTVLPVSRVPPAFLTGVRRPGFFPGNDFPVRADFFIGIAVAN